MCRECLFVRMDSDGIDVDGCLKEDILQELMEDYPSNRLLRWAYVVFEWDERCGEACCEPSPPSPCLIVPPHVNREAWYTARVKAVSRFERDMKRLAEVEA